MELTNHHHFISFYKNCLKVNLDFTDQCYVFSISKNVKQFYRLLDRDWEALSIFSETGFARDQKLYIHEKDLSGLISITWLLPFYTCKREGKRLCLDQEFSCIFWYKFDLNIIWIMVYSVFLDFSIDYFFFKYPYILLLLG